VTESVVSTRDLTTRHRRIAFDANVLIYLLERNDDRAEAVATIIDNLAADGSSGVLASIGVTEVLAGPARQGDAVGFEMLAAALRDLGFDNPVLDAAAAEDAAWIAGRTGARLPDAVHLACARAAGATAFLTNDRRIRSRRGLEVVYLDDLVATDG
jgi:predicted nucleic acid-binding protein